MHLRLVASAVSISLALSGCASQGQGGDNANTGETIAEGALLGCVLGGVTGRLAGGNNKGALVGCAAGGALGGAAGVYVAQEKQKYASVEARIAGEQQVAAQATATANAQTAASRARLQVINTQFAQLRQVQGDKLQAQSVAQSIMTGLQGERARLVNNRQSLQKTLKDQQSFIAETQQEIGTNDPAKTAQLAQWRQEIPRMQGAINAISAQIATIDSEATRLHSTVPDCCGTGT